MAGDRSAQLHVIRQLVRTTVMVVGAVLWVSPLLCAQSEPGELRVIRVESEVSLGGKSLSTAGPDYYIEGGESAGLRKSMLLDVYRPLTVHNQFRDEESEIRVLVGQITVATIFPHMAIARLHSLELSAISPIVTYRTIMVGDYVVPRPEGRARPVQMSLPSTVLFDFDSWVIKSDAHEPLSVIAQVLRQSSGQDLVIEGHTCNVGNADYNQALSLKRAQRVADFLIRFGGVPKSRIHLLALGETAPLTSNATEVGRKKNRRVDFRLIPRGTAIVSSGQASVEREREVDRQRSPKQTSS